MRRYEGGELIGEKDPPPEKTLDEWAADELKLARDKMVVVIESIYQLRSNNALSGRIGALQDLRREIARGRPL